MKGQSVLEFLRVMSEFDSSRDLFEDTAEDFDNSKEEKNWYGVPLEEIQRNFVFDNFYPVRPSSSHHVMFRVPLQEGRLPEPYPHKRNDVWSDTHVKMPHSSHNLFPVSESELEPCWDLIKSALQRNITNSKELETVIFSYNSKTGQRWSLEALHQFFSETVTPEESDMFFSELLPGIIRLALKIEDFFRGGLPLLKAGQSSSLSLSQEQAAILLANSFLCTFPWINTTSQPSKSLSINFFRLYQCGGLDRVQEKLKCFINYFRRILSNCPKGVITYSRRHVSPNSLPDWSSSDVQLPSLYISSEGLIENEGRGLLEVDFANKRVGGGVIGRGSVQEEIKFSLCPELIVCRLFTEALEDTEALIITGCERFSSHEGYGNTFRWSGNYVDDGERDCFRRLRTSVLAIDATRFTKPRLQYSKEFINRELNKAYSGFSAGRSECGPALATGNWGCGAFRGDPHLKSLLQLMAAGMAGRAVAYFTFGDPALAKDIHDLWSTLKTASVSVGTLWKMLTSYTTSVSVPGCSLYDYIYGRLGNIKGLTKEICFSGQKKAGEVEKADGEQSKNEVGEPMDWKSEEQTAPKVEEKKKDENRKEKISISGWLNEGKSLKHSKKNVEENAKQLLDDSSRCRPLQLKERMKHTLELENEKVKKDIEKGSWKEGRSVFDWLSEEKSVSEKCEDKKPSRKGVEETNKKLLDNSCHSHFLLLVDRRKSILEKDAEGRRLKEKRTVFNWLDEEKSSREKCKYKISLEEDAEENDKKLSDSCYSGNNATSSLQTKERKKQAVEGGVKDVEEGSRKEKGTTSDWLNKKKSASGRRGDMKQATKDEKLLDNSCRSDIKEPVNKRKRTFEGEEELKENAEEERMKESTLLYMANDEKSEDEEKVKNLLDISYRSRFLHTKKGRKRALDEEVDKDVENGRTVHDRLIEENSMNEPHEDRKLSEEGVGEPAKRLVEPGCPRICSKEPLIGETCSLQTKEGRKRALESEPVRWAAMSSFTSSSSPSSTPLSTPSTKRKISDYFIKIDK